MLTDADVQKLAELFPVRPEIEMIIAKVFDEKMEPFIENQQRILSGVDKFATAFEAQNLENTYPDSQLSRYDTWTPTIPQKTAAELNI